MNLISQRPAWISSLIFTATLLASALPGQSARANVAPENLSLSPANPSSRWNEARILTSVHRDQDGVADIKLAYLRFSKEPRFYYSATSNKLWGTDVSGVRGGFAPGSANVIIAGGVTLNCQASTVTKSGTDLTIQWHLTPRSGVGSGQINLGLSTYDMSDARDSANTLDGFETFGAWNVIPDNRAPSNELTEVDGDDSSHTSNAGQVRNILAQYGDQDGAADIKFAYVRADRPDNVPGRFMAYYAAASNRLWVWNGSAYVGGYAPGSANTITVPAGTVNCANTTVSRSGYTLRVNWNLTPSSAMQGENRVGLTVYDAENAGDAWEYFTRWNVLSSTGNYPPENRQSRVVTTNTIVGQPSDIWTSYLDRNGAEDITKAYFLVNETEENSGGLYLYYNNQNNTLWAWNGTQFVGGFTPGAPNSKIVVPAGTLDCQGTVVQRNRTDLYIKWKIIPGATLEGNQNLYSSVTDAEGSQDPLQLSGTLRVIPAGDEVPVNVSVSPVARYNTPGQAQNFTATYRDGNGVGDIKVAYLGVGTPTYSEFRVFYDVSSNKIWRQDDLGVYGGYAPGSNQTIGVGPYSVNCALTTVQKSGTDLVVNWNLNRSNLGARVISLSVYDSYGAYDPTEPFADWIVESNNRVPFNFSASVEPRPGTTGTMATIGAQYRDSNGYEDISYAYLLINSSSSTTGAFWAYYNTASNKIWVWNGSAFVGGHAPGSANNITVAQGTLHCSNVTIGRNGPALFVNWKFTPAASFTGSKGIYLQVFDKPGASDSYERLANWEILASAPYQAPAPEAPSGNTF